jgi:hypothetical protein
MIIQNLKNCPQTEVINGIHSYIDQTVCRFNNRINAYKNQKLQRKQFHNFKRLSIKQLQDMGLNDPQAQIRVFGQYIDDSACCKINPTSGSWWAR